jgi:hypothetical protein
MFISENDKIRKRAYYYYINGCGNDQKINFERATKVQIKIDRWTQYIYSDNHYNMLRIHGKHYISGYIDDYDFGPDDEDPDPLERSNIYLWDDQSGDKIKRIYKSSKCCNHKEREGKYYFYYKRHTNPVPGLGPLCDDCLAELDENKIKDYDVMMANIINSEIYNTLNTII